MRRQHEPLKTTTYCLAGKQHTVKEGEEETRVPFTFLLFNASGSADNKSKPLEGS